MLAGLPARDISSLSAARKLTEDLPVLKTTVPKGQMSLPLTAAQVFSPKEYRSYTRTFSSNIAEYIAKVTSMAEPEVIRSPESLYMGIRETKAYTPKAVDEGWKAFLSKQNLPVREELFAPPIAAISSSFWTKKRAAIAAGGVAAILAGAAVFSGKDDEYNTIEGLSHKGLAGKLRKQNTDFGSGFKGMFQRAGQIVGRMFRPSPKTRGFSVTEIRGLAKYAETDTVSQFAKRLGVELKVAPPGEAKDILQGTFSLAPESWIQKAIKGGSAEDLFVKNIKKQGYVPGRSYVDPTLSKKILGGLKEGLGEVQKIFRSELKNMSQSELMSKISKDVGISIKEVEAGFASMKSIEKTTTEDISKMFIFHEAAEARNIKVLIDRVPKSFAQGKLGAMPSHNLTMPQEELFLRSYQKGKIRSAIEPIRQASDGWFSGFDDKYNTIEGLRHGGLAPVLRKILTDFGSGFDALKGVATRLGVTIPNLLRRRGFQKALHQGTIIERIGKGRWSDVYRMQTEYKGQTFSYVKKQTRPLREVFEDPSAVDKPADWLLSGFNLKKEARMMKGLEETAFAPTVYGLKGDSLYMELMKGTPVAKLLEQGDLKAVRMAEKSMESGAVKELTERGIWNPDISPTNTIWNKREKVAHVVDYGLAEKRVEFMRESTKDMMMAHYEIRKKVFKKTLGKAPTNYNSDNLELQKIIKIRESLRIKNLESAKTIRATQAQIWEAARNGGRSHTRPTGGHVTHCDKKLGGGV